MQFKKILANIVLFTTLIGNIPITVYADDDILNKFSEMEVEKSTINNKDLNEQLDELYMNIGSNLNIDYKFVKILHILAGGKAVYAEKKPNIYSDITVESMKSPFQIGDIKINTRLYQQIECPDSIIERPSEHYIPDAAYTVTYDIVQLMNERLEYDRGSSQSYFDALTSTVKKEIIFTEAVMKYIGESEDTINNYYNVYEKLMQAKAEGENIVEIYDNNIQIKDEYIGILSENNITNEETIKYISIILSFDTTLANDDNSAILNIDPSLPYIPNYTSRENMMQAAMSLAGKVRYVYGGGHSGMSEIDGINPLWVKFRQLYSDEPTYRVLDEETGIISEIPSQSYKRCIKPSGSWCPIHGESSSLCTYDEPMIYSFDDYVNKMEEYVITSDIDTEKTSEVMNGLKFYNGISLDSLNGLDCSGFASWVYNQITDRYTINSSASEFTNAAGIQEIAFGEELLPGDVFAWSSHIVVIVGKVSDYSNAYVTIESTPNLIKFGVVYYSGAYKSEIEEAKEIARQANQLIGGIYNDEYPHVYCMNDYAGSVNREGTLGTFYNSCHIGRYIGTFNDEYTIIENYGKPIKDMCAKDIIQHIITKLPYTYISGYGKYEGDLFDKTLGATNLGIE